MTSLNKLGQLSAGERRLLLQAVLLLPIIHISLFFLGYYRLHKILEKFTPLKRINSHRSDAQVLQQAREIARIVSIAAEHGLYKATCLRRSLLVWWFLRKEDIESRICFGVRIIAQQLEAHAWVEYNGVVINDFAGVHEDYQALEETLPPTKFGL